MAEPANAPPPKRSLVTREGRQAARQRKRRRRQVRALVAALVLIAAVSTGAAYQAGRGSAAIAGQAPAPPATPIMSVRRVGPLVAQRLADAQIGPLLDQVVAKAPASTCLTVQIGGHVVYARNPDLPVTPASTQKLVTATALLDQLGPETKLRTSVVAAAKPRPDGVVPGDVWLVGGGDPLLETKAYADHFFDQPQLYSRLEVLADSVAASGVKRIDGRVLGDESRFDQLRVVPSWSPRFVQQHQLGPLSALTVNDNVTAWPPKQIPLTPDGNAVADPPANAAQQLALLLSQRGIVVSGTGAGTAPHGAPELAALDSLPLRQIIAEMLQESDNQTAEVLTKGLGLAKAGAGSTAAGVDVIKRTVTALGLPAAGLGSVDGSGLDDTNKQTCRILGDTLANTRESGALSGLLAVAGRTGTLSARFKGSPVEGRLMAKTGSLNGVSALAGVLPTARGTRLAFAFVQNGTGAGAGLQDELAVVLDGYQPVGLATADQLGPQPSR